MRKNFKIMMVLFIICTVLSISAVGAVGAAEADMVVSDVDNTTSAVLVDDGDLSKDLSSSLNGDEAVLNDLGSDEVGNSVSNGDVEWGTFTELAGLIENGGFVKLEKNYRYVDGDESYIEGIIINGDLTLDGNNKIIDGNNVARAFNISNIALNINNLSFINCSAASGGAIYSDGGILKISDCWFVNCNSTGFSDFDGGGAIYSYGDEFCNLSCTNTNFICCSAFTGGAIYSYWFMDCTNCSFVNCSAIKVNNVTGLGGAISNFWFMDCTNCSFVNCSAGYNGGAIYNYYGSLICVNSTFVNCSAVYEGGAIASVNLYDKFGFECSLSCDNCTFMNCSAEFGSAVLVYYVNTTINYCIFDNSFGDKGTVAFGKCELEIYGKPTLDYTTINLDDNYWGRNCTTEDEFKNYHLLAHIYTPSPQYIIYQYWEVDYYCAPYSWVLMEIIKPKFVIVGYNYTFNVTLNTLNTGKTFTGYLPDYMAKVNDFYINDEGGFSYTSIFYLNIIDGGDSFNYTPTISSEYSFIASSLNGDWELTRNEFPIVPNDSFTALEFLIEKAIASNEDLDLNQTYQYYDRFDSDYKSGLIINGTLTINGKGKTINANDAARIFNVDEKGNLTLNDLIITNVNYTGSGGAIYNNGIITVGNLTISNCHNTEEFLDGGAIYNNGLVTVIGNLNITNCSSITYVEYRGGGAAIYNNNGVFSVIGNLSISKCYLMFGDGVAIFNRNNFTVTGNLNISDCYARYGYGGAIYNYRANLNLSSSSFMNCSADVCGGAIYSVYGNLSCIDCSFVNCSADNTGGAIYIYGNLSCVNCSFVNCSSVNRGGAIDTQLNSTLTGCSFVNCIATTDSIYYPYPYSKGITISNFGNLTCIDCSFVNCSYPNDGIIFNYYGYLSCVNCSFVNSSLNNCGEIYNNGGIINIYDSIWNFTNIYSVNGTMNIINSTIKLNMSTFIKGDNPVINASNSNLTVVNSIFDSNYHNDDNYVIVNNCDVCDLNNNYWSMNLTSNNQFKDASLVLVNDDVFAPDNWVLMNITGPNEIRFFDNYYYEVIFKQLNNCDVFNGSLPNYTIKVNNDIYVNITNCKGTFNYTHTNTTLINLDLVATSVNSDNELVSFNVDVKPPKGSFTDLQLLIYDAIDNGHVLDLNQSYKYDDRIDPFTIYIMGNLTINGNNYTIDGNNVVRAFEINSYSNLILNNLIFSNCYSNITSIGGAIYIFNGTLNISSCCFVNCSALYNGGAIYNSYANLTVSSCSFVNCSASEDYSGGAIYNTGSLNCTDSIFDNCFAGSIGVIIYSCCDYIYSSCDSFNVDNNYWGVNFTEKSQFENIGLIYYNFNNFAPNKWIVMNITGPALSIACQDNDYKVVFNKLNDGSDYNGILYDYTVNIDNKDVIIHNNEGNFTAKPNTLDDFTLIATSVNNGNELSRATFTVTPPIDSFTKLNEDIINSNGNLILNHDYKYYESIDTAFKNGITINGNLTINGNNKTINGNGARAFNIISSGNLTIDGNLIIYNCSSSYGYDGGAIYNDGILNCYNSSFVNCSASPGYNGGAIYNNGSLNCSSCSFINSTGYYGGAIHNNVYENRFYCNECTFIHCSAGYVGGAIYTKGPLNSTGCSFIYCSASDGAAICTQSSLNCSSCSFVNCSVDNIGGAIYTQGSLNCSSCSFVNCSAYLASAIYLLSDGTINNCIFDNSFNDKGVITIEGNFNLNVDGNYWSVNSTTPEEFNKTHLIAYSSSYSVINYVVPNYWIIMNITAPGKIIIGKNTTFNATLNTLNDGSIYNDVLPDYTFIFNDQFVTIHNSIGSFNYTPTSNNFNIIATSPNSGNILVNSTFTATKQDVNVTVDVKDIILGDNLSLDANVTDVETSLIICGKEGVDFLIFNASNDLQIIDYTNLPIGNYYVIAHFNGTDLYNEGNSSKKYFNVVPEDSFTALQILVNEAINNNQDIDLETNYQYYGQFDSKYITGVVINSTLTINGNNKIINGNNTGRAFYSNGNLSISGNLTIINCSADYGGAIFNYEGVLNCSGCSFVNCSADYGGAIFNYEGVLNCSGCSFAYCSATTDGGAICNYGDVLNCSGCSFAYCSADGDGGAICNYGGVLNCSGCSFVNCSAADDGGAIVSAGSCNIFGVVSFVNCSATDWGGAIDCGGSCNIFGVVSFVNCSADYGGAISNYVGVLNCSSSSFVNCSATVCGNAIYIYHSNGTSNNCIFDNCFGNKGTVAIFGDCNVNLDNNYWSTNANTTEEFNKTHLIAYVDNFDEIIGYSVPNNWVIMNINNSTEIIANKNATFNVTLNTLNDGSVYNDVLPDYTVNIDGQFITIHDGVGSFNYTPSTQNFNIIATSPNSGNVLVNSTFTATPSIKDVDVNITVSNITYGEGSPIDGVTVVIYEKGTSIVVGDKNNVTFIIYNANGNEINNSTWNNLAAGNYQIIAIYEGLQDIYNPANSTKVNFTVEKAISNIVIGDIGDVSYGTDVSSLFKANVTDDNGIVIATVTNFTVWKDENEIPQTEWNKLNIGEYTLVATFPGNENYTNKSKNKTFKVINADISNFNITVNNITYGNNFIISVNDISGITGKLSGNLTVTVTNEFNNINDEYNFTIEEGTGTFTIPVLYSAGNYNINVKFKADNYNEKNITTENVIAKFTPTVNITVENINYSQYPSLKANVTGINQEILDNSTVEFHIFNETNEIAKDQWNNLPVGIYTVYATYPENENYTTVNSTNKTFEVFNATISENITILISSEINYGEDLVIVISNATGIGGIKLNGTLTITITKKNTNGNDEYTFNITDGEGICKIEDSFAAGEYNVIATFKANNYNPVVNNTVLTINQNTPNVEVIVNDIIYYGNNPNFISNVTGVNHEILDNSSVEFHVFNGTDEVAKDQWNNLPVGNYTVYASYPGNENYTSANSTNKTFKIIDIDAEIFIKDHYNCTMGDIINVTVGITKKADNYIIKFYVESLSAPVVVNANQFVDGGDNKFYYNFTVNTLGCFAKRVGLNAVLYDDGDYVDSDNSWIDINYTAPSINDVNITGNYSDYVNITFVVVNGLDNDVIILHHMDGYNLTANVTNGKATFENVYLSKATIGNVITSALYTRENVYLTESNVYWNVSKLDTNITFNPINVTEYPNVMTSVNVSVYDAKGVLVKSGQINITDENIVLLNENGTAYEGTIYNLTNGSAIVYFKYTDNGNYTPKFDYINEGAIWSNNDNYNLSNATLNVTISTIDTKVNVDEDSYDSQVGKEFNITGNVTSIGSSLIPKGNVTVDINGVKFNATVGSDGKFTIPITYNVSGTYTVKVEYNSENSSIWENSESSEFIVTIRALNVYIISNYESINAYIAKYNKTRDYIFNVTDENGAPVLNGTFILNMRGEQRTVNVTNGQANITNLTFDEAKFFNFIANYVGNEYYKNTFNFTNVNVTKIATHIQINGSVNDEGKELNITVLDEDNNTVTSGVIYYVTPDGQEHMVNVTGETLSINIPANRTGEYNIAVSYYDLKGGYLYNRTDFNYNITVIDMTSNFQLLPPNGDDVSESTIRITFEVKDDNGNPISDGKIKVMIGSDVYTVDVIGGVAELDVVALGPIMVIAQYDGEDCIPAKGIYVVEPSYDTINYELATVFG